VGQDSGISKRVTTSARRATALAVAWVAARSVLDGFGRADHHRQWLLGWAAPAGLPSAGRALTILLGLVLLATAPRLWQGIRTAAPLAIAALAALTAAQLENGHIAAAGITLALGALLGLGLILRAFPLGCRNRPRRGAVVASVVGWGMVWIVLSAAALAGPLRVLRDRHDVHVIVHSAVELHLSGGLVHALELSILLAAGLSALALRSLMRAASGGRGHTEEEDRAARAILARHAEDSLSPFTLRADKALHFAAGGFLAYRVIGETAVVSADPIAPEGRAGDVLGSFLELAHRRGWQVTLWGAGREHLASYRQLGMRALCVGEEAFVDPSRFTLSGRPVRKLRQSVMRVRRRGWEITALEGRALEPALEAELARLEARWRAQRSSMIGFAMGMGEEEPEIAADDLFVLGRSPEGQLGAVMRFAAYRGRLSLDTMRRVGDTPNGLNEAMICRALEVAREQAVSEVSLNYAGLAHLVRRRQSGGRPGLGGRLAMALLGHRFQMERLVRFNEKFAPEWRPRHLVYESRLALPRSVLRVLQAEGYVPERIWPTREAAKRSLPRGRAAASPARRTA
jgi:lysyl-tRNA synthetase class 2